MILLLYFFDKMVYCTLPLLSFHVYYNIRCLLVKIRSRGFNFEQTNLMVFILNYNFYCKIFSIEGRNMDIILGLDFLDILINLDSYLSNLINNYGSIAYLIIFLIIFCETGLVVTPFLPGDSMIFVLGALGASGQINLLGISSMIILAAILGNMLNYQIGRFIGPKVFERESSRFFKQEYLLRTHAFFEKHGGKTIVLARFIPIIRTFAPFVAGIGEMEYQRFTLYNIVGSVSWVLACLAAGYLFGNIPIVEQNFTLIIVAIIVISLIPAIVISLRQKVVNTQKQFSK